jgi:Tfp pilus assembly protein PilF
MRALQGHDYRSAQRKFQEILADESAYRTLSDRARVYLGICERELGRGRAEPTTIEDRLTQATAALNAGDEKTAERLARLVAGQDSQQDLAHYLLAAVEARRGNTQTALASLSLAIALRPDLTAQALHDADFERIRETDEFRHLTEPSASKARSHGRSHIDR